MHWMIAIAVCCACFRLSMQLEEHFMELTPFETILGIGLAGFGGMAFLNLFGMPGNLGVLAGAFGFLGGMAFYRVFAGMPQPRRIG